MKISDRPIYKKWLTGVKVIAFLLLMLNSMGIKAQTLIWNDLFGPTLSFTVQVSDMKADNQGNLVVAGEYPPGCVLNGKALPKSRFTAIDGIVSFIAKFDTSGRLLWMDTTSYITDIFHLEISPEGNYFFSGACSTTGDPFGAPNPTALHSKGFIGKCDPNGKMIWVRKYLDYPPTNNINQTIDYFKIDQNENIYFVAELSDSADNFKIDTDKYYSQDSSKSCLLKFDRSGNLVWQPPKLPVQTVEPNQLDIDNKGNSFVVCRFMNLPQKNINVLYKFNKAGNLVKEFTLDTAQIGQIVYVATDNFGNVYLSCLVSDTLNLRHEENTRKPYNSLIKLDTNFNINWALFSNSGVSNLFISVNKVTNSIYAVGSCPKPIIFGGHATLNAPADTWPFANNIFVARINTNGIISWFANTTHSNTAFWVPIIGDNCGNLFMAFSFEPELHFRDLNYIFPHKGADNAAVIAKFSSDSLGFVNQNASCGLSLKNISDPVFTQFQWYAKDTTDTSIGKLIATTRNLYYLFPHKGRYIITLQAIKGGGCTNTIQDTFNVNSSPVAGYSTADTQGCQYVNFYFTDTSHADTINAAIGQSWQWDFGDHSPPLTYSKTKRPVVSHVYTQSGGYTVTLVYGNGLCTDTFTSQKKVVIIPAPKPGFSVLDTAGCVPLAINVADEGQGSVVSWLYVVKKVPLAPFLNGDSVRTSSFGDTFSVPGDYIIHQYLTGTTGCVTEDSQMVYATPVFSASDSANMDYVTVDSGNAIGVKWATYPGALRYGLYRYTDNNMGASLLAAQTSDTSYIDNNGLNPNQHSYTYYVQGQDGCGHATSAGRLGKSIKLGGFEDNDLLPELVWNRYAQWQSGVKTYHVYRENSNGSYTFLGDTKDTFYTDEGFANNETYGACYKVEAVSADSQYSSTSNIYCFSSGPQIYIPDIFTPNGDTLNDVFAPVCMGIKQYTMTIINRWGEKVYNSDEASPRPSPKGEGGGWNGSFKGQPAPQGIYVYYIKALDYNGNTIIRKGMVVLGE